VIVTKIAKVGVNGEVLERAITRYTNSQNAIREKDFLALTNDFRTWARQMEDRYGVFLETQRGGWDSRRALQKQKPEIRQFTEYANAFDLLKVYGSGWMGEAGIAFGKNPPFLPNGAIFKRIMAIGESGDGEPFGVEDLYAAYRLQGAADSYRFGRVAEKQTRRQTRFLYYMIVLDLLMDVMTRAELLTSQKSCTRALTNLFEASNEASCQALLDYAIEVVDSYLTQGTDECVFDEPAYKNVFNFDLNGFLKWESLGKGEQNCPRFRSLLAVIKLAMGRRQGGQPSARDMVTSAIASTN
jgi:hypothetical protein